MRKKSRTVISDKYQDLTENKENIKEIAMVKNSKKSAKVSRKHGNVGVKELAKVSKDCVSEIQDAMASKPVVLLPRLNFEAFSYNSSNSIVDYAKNADNRKTKNNSHKCPCHSSLLLKEAVIVLEKVESNLDYSSLVTNSSLILRDEGKAKKVPNKSGKGTKRKKEEKSKDEDKDSSKPSKSKKQKDSAESKNTKKEKIPDLQALDFNNESKSPNGNAWNFKISSWNINGIRAWLEKNGLSFLSHEAPDILCLQETKCSDDKLPDEMKNIDGYHTYWLAGDKDGYSGVGLLTKEKPIKVEYGIGIPEHDNEGRVITAEYEKFYLVSTYVPNAGRGLVRLDYRMKWDKDFREYLKKLDAEKPVILVGDLNVAHEEIDLANPKTNKKNAGFTKEEREGFSALLKEGFVDTFRHLYPDMKGAYTFWTYMMNARAKNVGWRLDYFVISERFTENLCDNVIRKDVFGSDHCPITLFLAL